VEALDRGEVITENYEPLVISREESAITLADPRLLESEKIIYIDKIDLEDMRLFSSVIHDFGSSAPTIENYLLGCQKT